MKAISFISALVVVFILMTGCSSSSSGQKASSDTVFLESGVKYVVLNAGDGAPITAGTEVATNINLMVNTLNDTVWTTYDDIPFAFVAQKTSLIQGFDEIVMLMKKGDRFLVVIPSQLGYGARGNGPDIPPNATLFFDLDILDVRPPRIPASDVLFEAWKANAVDGIKGSYDTIKGDDDTYKLDDEEWYILSVSLADNKAWEDIVSMWDFKLDEKFLLGGYYYQARAYDSLNQIAKAIIVMEKAVELDSTENPNIKGYLEALKERQ
jgi:hypothetical protein